MSLSEGRIIIISRGFDVERIIILMGKNKSFLIIVFVFLNFKRQITYGRPFCVLAFVDEFGVFFAVVDVEEESPQEQKCQSDGDERAHHHESNVGG